MVPYYGLFVVLSFDSIIHTKLESHNHYVAFIYNVVYLDL